ncbi:hypothetical protein HYG77_35100 (plasmid) [Rhodococcus sp. ZPP]|uniref:hypothetical protein n=1 Tax=Rhodococcus sp. ZPP TaxID=2749906 RepID=UPI001AD872E0|nr:hypothetical protein [Rhodococcus sp. ZPP]QTJ70692.1 hypothetical protein HYG77_35100 [Rhodococcus sp. ZPP]
MVLLTLVDHFGSGGDDEDALRAVAQATTTWLAAAADLGISSSAFAFRSHGRSSVQLTPVQRDGHRLGSAGRALPGRSGTKRLHRAQDRG